MTRWQSSTTQSFELEFILENKNYKYCLDLEYEDNNIFVNRESFSLNSKTLFKIEPIPIDDEREDIYNELTILEYDEESIAHNINYSRSAFSFSRIINSRLFVKGLSNIFLTHINPFDMNSESRTEDKLPIKDLSNFSAWYIHLSQSEQGKIIKLTLELQKILTAKLIEMKWIYDQ